MVTENGVDKYKKYKVVYADPPWSYNHKYELGYSTMTLEQIMSLPIQNIMSNNSVLFLWVTCPMQEEAMEVMKAWGYTYKTKIYWRKMGRLGMGFWFRGVIEELWLGVKGEVKAFGLQIPNYFKDVARVHSQKPDYARTIIEMTRLEPRIELFARQKIEGWDAWGNEVDSDIELIPTCDKKFKSYVNPKLLAGGRE